MTEPLPVRPVGAIDIALEWEVRAPLRRAWEHFFAAPQTWWPGEFRALGTDTQMTFAPAVGAQLIERNGKGAALAWYTVFALDPERSVDMEGSLAARYGGPAKSLIHIEFAPGKSPDRCTIKMMDSLFGRLGPEMAHSVTEGWNAILGAGFAGSLKR